jgi:hypothetical protein
LQLAEFIIFTDQKSLTHLEEQRLHTLWQQKFFTKMMGMHYRIIYKKGADNRVADALSRHPSPPAQLMALSQCTPAWLTQVQDGYANDEAALKMIQQLTLSP